MRAAARSRAAAALLGVATALPTARQSCASFVQLIPRVEAVDEVCCTAPGACTSITSSLALPAVGAECPNARCADAFIPFWDDCQDIARTLGLGAAGHGNFYTSCEQLAASPRLAVDVDAEHEQQAAAEPKPAVVELEQCSPAQQRTCEGSGGAEPSGAEYFGAHADDARGRKGQPFEPPRLSNITAEQFAEAGWPVIVTDVSRDWPMHGWTCEPIGRQFPDRKMRTEYMADPWADPASGPDTDSQPLGEIEKWMGMRLSSGAEDPAHAAPEYAPFYWDVKEDAEHSEANLLEHIRNLTRVPYFMEAAALRELQTTPEFWFSARGARAKAHMDPRCESSKSVQLAGTKFWRLPPIPTLVGQDASATFGDGALYTQAFVDRHLGGIPWVPTFEFELTQGEGLFFPPGFIHETKNVGDELECAASITYQYETPLAARYFRMLMSRVHRTADLNGCHATMGDMATVLQLSTTAAQALLAGAGDAVCLAAHELSSAVDADDNNAISLARNRQRTPAAGDSART